MRRRRRCRRLGGEARKRGLRNFALLRHKLNDNCFMIGSADGWMFICKLCGKSHEVPEQIAPYWKDAQTFAGIPVGDMTLGSSETSGMAQYSFSDFKSFRITS